jgi:hypothetical protein
MTRAEPKSEEGLEGTNEAGIMAVVKVDIQTEEVQEYLQSLIY